ncbi:transcriptional regulator [Pseudomonas floridensis]|uniref:Transcriptional regulator n=1 Tax=Pseudomonas floridensis TaxID=1958950 RepID=A0A1X0N592_9PSED|nr:XRE family transcriptional regulator [Pseudomonas floridensis]ORC58690.1 transcriptional regulator [Pseudomonas floridensis]
MQQKDRLKKTCTDIGNKIKSLRNIRGLSLGELSKLSGVSKAALSQLESGNSNPRIDTLDSVAIALRLPLGDLLLSQDNIYPCLERFTQKTGTFSQDMLFRIGLGNISEIWNLRMDPSVTIKSPAHNKGTKEHIFVHEGVLTLDISGVKERLNEGDFYAFSGDVDHTYESGESSVSATVVMSYAAS